jgi:hypothetical protein
MATSDGLSDDGASKLFGGVKGSRNRTTKGLGISTPKSGGIWLLTRIALVYFRQAVVNHDVGACAANVMNTRDESLKEGKRAVSKPKIERNDSSS